MKEENVELIRSLLASHQVRPDTGGVIQSLTFTEKRTAPPLLHSLSSLQAAANRLWKVSPANVLEVVQSLYEKKWVTYPRTDTRHITTNEFSYLAERVSEYQTVLGNPFTVNSLEPSKRFVDNSQVVEHCAITLTRKIPTANDLEGLSDVERNIYEEILRTTLAMFHSDYLYMETKVTTDVNGIPFFTTGNTERDEGWKSLFIRDEEPGQDSKKEEPTIPLLQENESVHSKIGIKEGNTTPPKPYTEGQLISMMKTVVDISKIKRKVIF